jgi:HPt (histidine-containing phosphotransfer) domain-containing protein
MKAGMVGFLPKPLRMDELSQALGQHARAGHDNATKSIAAHAYFHSRKPAITLKKEDSKQDALINWTQLEQYKEIDDAQRSITREVIKLFMADGPQRLHGIRAAVLALDADALSRATHVLKGAAAVVGAQALADACAALERACQQGAWPADAGQQADFIAVLEEKTRYALQQWKTQWLAANPGS